MQVTEHPHSQVEALRLEFETVIERKFRFKKFWSEFKFQVLLMNDIKSWKNVWYVCYGRNESIKISDRIHSTLQKLF